MKRKSNFDEYSKYEFTNDIVFARFINYMKLALKHKRMDYDKHQDFLKRKEQKLSHEEWTMLSNKDSKVYSFFDFEETKELEIALNQLTSKQRFIIINHYYKKQSLTHIAKQLNMTDEAVRQMKLRAMNRLKKILEGYYYDEKN
jgi:RNA polymerase sigma factor (sigma-70 family)